MGPQPQGPTSMADFFLVALKPLRRLTPIWLSTVLIMALANVNHSRWQDTLANHSSLMCQTCSRVGGVGKARS